MAYENIKLENQVTKLSDRARNQLEFWINVVLDLEKGFHIHNIPKNPPLGTVIFACDAAGCSENVLNFDIGVGAAYIDKNNNTVIMQDYFDREFVTVKKDDSNRKYGCKTTLLELIAVFLPIYHFIPFYTGKNIIIHTDNKGLFYAWSKGRSDSCLYTSCLLKALMYVSCQFSVNLIIYHKKRRSTHLSLLADILTRCDNESDHLKSVYIHQKYGLAPSIKMWMKNPFIDNIFGAEIVHDIMKFHNVF